MFIDLYMKLIDNEYDTNTFLLISVILFTTISWVYFIYTKFTDEILFYGLKIYRIFAGLSVKYVPRKGGNGVWCYAEKGERLSHKCKNKEYPTFLFLHGFGADKDTWPSMIRHIPSKYHCIIIDMPGHGETTFLKDVDDYKIDNYARSIREFLEVMDLHDEKIYLIGCSFGGAVAGLFAHLYPENVKKLGLLCPAIKTPTFTKTFESLVNGNFELLIPRNGDEFVKMISLLTHKQQPYPKRIFQSFVNLNFTLERQEILEKLLKNMLTVEFQNFEDRFKKMTSIEHETLIIWGENDEMLHVSGGRLLKENVKNASLKIIKNCNHCIQLDEPWQATKALLDFLN